MRVGALALAAFLALADASLSGCAAREPRVELKGVRYTVAIADSLDEQARGLMFVREMPRDRGMLFVYAQAQPQAFWMKNCYIALDILFFDADARFINGHYDVPVCRGDPCPSYASTAPARYVLELNGGVGRALGLARGDVLTLP
ncbi:MAG TPA: DUF192 domain-containing protein [Candidatus Saccharimonadia bacterium]|nr:DUF192 domain-containing protein [Candidatus Saccharimonadia bacterium]